MYCRNCGNEVGEKASVCTNCGFKPLNGHNYCQNCGTQTKEKQSVCVECGMELNEISKVVPENTKSKVAAGLLAILLGSLGVHKFYLGYSGAGIVMLLVSLISGILTFGIGTAIIGFIALIEGIIYLTKSDEDFYNTYVKNKKSWF